MKKAEIKKLEKEAMEIEPRIEGFNHQGDNEKLWATYPTGEALGKVVFIDLKDGRIQTA